MTDEPEAPLELRLYGMMQALMGAYANREVPPSIPVRSAVEKQDALDAVAGTSPSTATRRAMPWCDSWPSNHHRLTVTPPHTSVKVDYELRPRIPTTPTSIEALQIVDREPGAHLKGT